MAERLGSHLTALVFAVDELDANQKSQGAQ